MKKILLALSIGMFGCSDIERVEPKLERSVGCYCLDGTYKVQNYNILKETGNLTSNPCFGHGGVLSYVYLDK